VSKLAFTAIISNAKAGTLLRLPFESITSRSIVLDATYLI